MSFMAVSRRSCRQVLVAPTVLARFRARRSTAARWARCHTIAHRDPATSTWSHGVDVARPRRQVNPSKRRARGRGIQRLARWRDHRGARGRRVVFDRERADAARRHLVREPVRRLPPRSRAQNCPQRGKNRKQARRAAAPSRGCGPTAQRGARRQRRRVRDQRHRRARAPQRHQVERHAPHRLVRERGGEQQEQRRHRHDAVVAPRARLDELERAHEHEQRLPAARPLKCGTHEHASNAAEREARRTRSACRAAASASTQPAGSRARGARRQRRAATATHHSGARRRPAAGPPTNTSVAASQRVARRSSVSPAETARAREARLAMFVAAVGTSSRAERQPERSPRATQRPSMRISCSSRARGRPGTSARSKMRWCAAGDR